MTKPRWQLALDALAEEMRREAQHRRTLTPRDAAADASDHWAARVEEVVRDVQNPAAMLSPAEWAAEQDPLVLERTARRWCERGELEHERDESGRIRIPAGARRRVGITPVPAMPTVSTVASEPFAQAG